MEQASGIDIDQFINDHYARLAFAQAHLDYDAALMDYSQLALNAKDAITGAKITDPKRVTQIWVKDEPLIRHYASPEAGFKALAQLEAKGKAVRVFHAQDRESGIKLFGNTAWYVRSNQGQLDTFLDKNAADAWAKIRNGEVLSFAAVKSTIVANR